VTVHHRHLDVHQHQVEMAGTKLFDRRLTVCRHLQLVRGMFQVRRDERANVLRVVNQQDAATAAFSGTGAPTGSAGRTPFGEQIATEGFIV